MTEPLTFEVGKHYRTRDDRKALCVHVWIDGSAAIVSNDWWCWCWKVNSAGRYAVNEHSFDIVGEWREPRQWTVYVVEYSDDDVDVTFVPGVRRVLARVTVTEGEGLESGRADFEKDMT